MISIYNSSCVRQVNAWKSKDYWTRGKSNLLIAPMDHGAILIAKTRIDKTRQVENTLEGHSKSSGLTIVIESMKKQMSDFAVNVDHSRTSAMTAAFCGSWGMEWSLERKQGAITCRKDFRVSCFISMRMVLCWKAYLDKGTKRISISSCNTWTDKKWVVESCRPDGRPGFLFQRTTGCL